MSCQAFSRNIGPALIAWFLLIFLTGLYLVFICWDFSEETSYAFTAGHSLLFFFVISAFGRATFMDPGYYAMGVPGEKMTTMEKGSPRTVMYKSVDINGIPTRLKWCVTCEFYRPPRCSHCSICKHCIDTFDHHCPWLNNCIGRRNYRYFFSFLLSLTLHMIIVFGVSVTYVLMRTNQLSHYKVIIAIGVLILVGLLLLPVLGLTGFHIFLVSKGRTTNEQVTSKYDLDMNPYDRGLYRNWMNIFCTSQLPVLNRSNVVEVDMWGISYNGKSIPHLQASDFRSSLNNSELPNNCKPSDDSANAVKENAIVCEKTDSRNKINHATEQQNTADDVVAGVHRDLDNSLLPNANGKNASVNDSPNALVIAADQEMVSRSQSPVHGRSGEIKVNSNPSSLGIKSKLLGNKDQGKGQQTDTYTPKHIANLHSMGVDSVSAAQTGGNVQMEIMSNRDHFGTAGDHKTPLLRSQENSDVELIRGRQLQKFTSDNQSKSSNSLQRKQQEQGITVGIGRSSSRDFNPSRSSENTCPRTSSTSMMNLRDRVSLSTNTSPATFSQSRYGTAQDLNVTPSSPKSHSPLTVRDMHHGLSGVHTSNPQFVNYPHNNVSKGFMKSVRSDHRRHPPTHQVSRTPGTQGNQKHVLSHHSGAIHQLPPQSPHGLPPPLPPHGSQMSIPHVRPMWSPVVPPHGLSVSSPYFSPFDTTSHLSDGAPTSHLRLVRPPYFGNPNICPVDESHFFIDNSRLNESSVSKNISHSFASAYNPSVITQASSRPTPPLPPHNRIVSRSNAPNNRMQLTGPKNANHLIPGWQLEGDSSSPDGTFEISV